MTHLNISEGQIRQLWARMAEIYGSRWTSAYGADASSGAGLTWAKGLFGCTAQQVANGLSAALVSADPWPPTLPQFRALCLGIPSLHVVSSEIWSTGERSQFTMLALQYIDFWRLRQAAAHDADRMIAGAYERAREHVMSGGALPEKRVAIEVSEPKEFKPASDEVAVASLAKAEAAILKAKAAHEVRA